MVDPKIIAISSDTPNPEVAAGDNLLESPADDRLPTPGVTRLVNEWFLLYLGAFLLRIRDCDFSL
jgi:hypothetical protein